MYCPQNSDAAQRGRQSHRPLQTRETLDQGMIEMIGMHETYSTNISQHTPMIVRVVRVMLACERDMKNSDCTVLVVWFVNPHVPVGFGRRALALERYDIRGWELDSCVCLKTRILIRVVVLLLHLYSMYTGDGSWR